MMWVMWTMCRGGSRVTDSHLALNGRNLVYCEMALLTYSVLVVLMLALHEVLLHLLVHPYLEGIAAMPVVSVTKPAVLMHCHHVWLFVSIELVNISV